MGSRLNKSSTPISQKNTPVQRALKTLRRSILIESASKSKALEKSTVESPLAKTPLAIMRATSAIRRSFSRDNTPKEKVENTDCPFSPTTQGTPTKSTVSGEDLMCFDTPVQPPKSVKKASTQKKAKELLGSFFLTPSRHSARLSLSQTPNYKL